MSRFRLIAPLGPALLLTLAASAQTAALAACVSSWHVTTVDIQASRRAAHVECVDGDPRCDHDALRDGHCTFAVSPCARAATRSLAACRQVGRITALGRRAFGASLPSPGAGCEAARSIQVALRGKRTRPRASRRLRLAMTTRIGKKMRRARLLLRCLPAAASTPAAPQCPPNPQGPEQPNEVRLTFADRGSDFDLGWTGALHNFALPGGTVLRACLAGCDITANPHCDVRVLTGPDSPNGTAFGPPLPLSGNGLPLWLVNEWSEGTFAGGTADLQTGAFEQTLALRSRVFMTDDEHVCPRCVGGTCDSGANEAGPCSVAGAFTGSRLDGPSQDCPPAAEGFIGVVPLHFTLTTGTAVLDPGGDGAATPCAGREGDPPGISPLADACGAGTCESDCARSACSEDGLTCTDLNGGISDRCCTNDTTLPCFPTATGSLERTGVARPLFPAWPGGHYPKTSDLTAVATFCAPATTADTVNTLVGLPGPAALVVPLSASWRTAAGDGSPPPPPPPGPSPY